MTPNNLTTDREDVPRAIYRIEANKNKSRFDTVKAFLTHMGYRVDTHLNVYEEFPDAEADTVAEKLLYNLENLNVDPANEDIIFLKNRVGFNKGAKLQFLENCEARMMALQGNHIDAILPKLYSAMNISYKNIDYNNIENELLLPLEIAVVHTIALAYRNSGDLEKAIDILTKLEISLTQMPMEAIGQDIDYIDITISLVQCLLEKEQNSKANSFSQKAYVHSLEYGRGYRAYDIAFLKAIALLKLGDMEESAELFELAYFGYMLAGMKDEANGVLKKFRTAYNTDLNTYGVDKLNIKPRNFSPLKRGHVPKCKNFGELLGLLRTEAGLSQKDLARGICDRSNYGRIESGTIEPGIYPKEHILQRLGRYPYYYTYNFLSMEEFEVNKKKKAIVTAISRAELDKAKSLINELEKSDTEKVSKTFNYFREKMGKVFILSSKAAISTGEEALNLLEEAINIAIPNFNANKIEDYRLCFDELQLLNRLGSYYTKIGKFFEAANIFKSLIKSMDKHYVDEYEKVRMYMVLQYNYADAIVEMGLFDEVIAIADEGRKLELKHRLFDIAPYFASVCGEALFEKGEKEKSRPYFAMAYHGLRLLRIEKHINASKESIKKMGIDILVK